MADKFNQNWINHLRRDADKKGKAIQARSIRCPVCDEEIPDANQFSQHVRDDAARHGSLDTQAAIDEALRSLTLEKPQTPATRSTNTQQQTVTSPRTSRKRRSATDLSGAGEADQTDMAPTSIAESSRRENKKFKSPTSSDVQQRGSPPPTPTSRSRARPPNDEEFDRGLLRPQNSRQLYDPKNDAPQPITTNRPTARPTSRKQRASASRQESADGGPGRQIDPEKPHTSLDKEPKTKPITLDQLVTEVKAIYVGLAMIESKCIEVDGAQSSNKDVQLTGDQMLALIALHRTLLHEHHDFFLASQHPAANQALRRLPSKYSMPARMWRHGIHSFLELLRHALPESYEHMLTFIYLAYSMMTLLLETVPSFKDTWIECLGDLSRYRMAIEDNDLKDREIWTHVSRYWYSCASENAPTTGRLYHHLAILARPNALQQLYYYTKSLCVPIPFASAKESIMTLFDPLLDSNTSRLSQVDACFVRVHGILFSGKNKEALVPNMHK
jgi:hypothetical protein